MILCAPSAEIVGTGISPVTEGILALHTLSGLYVRVRIGHPLQGIVCPDACFLVEDLHLCRAGPAWYTKSVFRAEQV